VHAVLPVNVLYELYAHCVHAILPDILSAPASQKHSREPGNEEENSPQGWHAVSDFCAIESENLPVPQLTHDVSPIETLNLPAPQPRHIPWPSLA